MVVFGFPKQFVDLSLWQMTFDLCSTRVPHHPHITLHFQKFPGALQPPKLDEDERDELIELLRDGQPWKSQEIQYLLAEEFDVEYHPNYLGTFLRNLGLSYAKPRPKRPHRPENPDDILEERVDDALDEDEQPHNKRAGEDGEGWIVDDDVCTDGGTIVGFFDASQPQPYDNSRRVWYVDDPHIERE